MKRRIQAPILEADAATFIWHGQRAPLLTGDFTDWEDNPPLHLKRTGPAVWSYRLPLPPDAYIEYAYLMDGERVADPLNPQIISNGFEKYNHYFYMPGCEPNRLVRRKAGIPHGKVSKHHISHEYLLEGGERSVYLYQPPAPGPYPLLVVWDGPEYLHRARLAEIVDNLIAEERIAPLGMALVDNAGSSRTVEYACNESALIYLLEALLPLAAQQLDLIDYQTIPGVHGVMGASMGGLMAMYTALRLPHLFGKAICQSGAYRFDDFDTVSYDLVKAGISKDVRLWLDVGIFEELLEPNRRMASLLNTHGYDHIYREFSAGHNYVAWRNDAWRGLEHLFGGAR